MWRPEKRKHVDHRQTCHVMSTNLQISLPSKKKKHRLTLKAIHTHRKQITAATFSTVVPCVDVQENGRAWKIVPPGSALVFQNRSGWYGAYGVAWCWKAMLWWRVFLLWWWQEEDDYDDVCKGNLIMDLPALLPVSKCYVILQPVVAVRTSGRIEISISGANLDTMLYHKVGQYGVTTRV